MARGTILKIVGDLKILGIDTSLVRSSPIVLWFGTSDFESGRLSSILSGTT